MVAVRGAPAQWQPLKDENCMVQLQHSWDVSLWYCCRCQHHHHQSSAPRGRRGGELGAAVGTATGLQERLTAFTTL